MIYVQWTDDGRWYLRNEAGHILSKMYDTYEDLLEDKYT